MTVHPANLRAPNESNFASRVFDRVVQHGGCDYYATRDMAAIFAARAEDVAGRHDTELVPLLHRDGVDLLLIGPTTVFVVSHVHSHNTTVSRERRTA